MVIVFSLPVALIVVALAAVCWAVWLRPLKTAGNWPLELFAWDFCFGAVLVAAQAILALGGFAGRAPWYFDDIRQSRMESLGWVILAGSLGWMGLMLLARLCGRPNGSLAFALAAAAALLVGAGLTFRIRPYNNPTMLAGGLALVVIGLAAAAARRNHDPLPREAGPARGGVWRGLLCGALLGIAFWITADAVNTRPGALCGGQPGPFVTVYFFAIGMFLANALLNPWLMRRPLAGPPLKLADYLGGTARQHLCGLLGGALWGLGLLGSLVAGARLGLAAAYVFALSAAAVAALVWRRGAVATRAAHALAAAACLACVGGLGLFAAAQGVEYDVFADPPPPGPPGPPPSKLDVHFVPTPNDVVEMMLRQVNVQSGDVLYDLGCGDGRIVITAARLYGCRGYGCDLDPQRIVESRRNAAKYGVEHLVTFEEKNVFTVDVSEATVVATYLLPWMNVRLLPQLAKLRPGARFVTHEFGAEGVKADYTLIMESEETAREHTIRVYTAPLRREGAPPAENHVVP